MFLLQKITLTHFKNYEFNSFDFSGNVVGICGLNGRGKTNLLDAIYYCCFTKSYFSNTDLMNIKFDKPGFRLEALFKKQNNDQKVICIHRGVSKKEFSINDTRYEKLSAHIGSLPVVMIAPDDVELVTGNSEGRRKFIDTVLSQVDASYLQELITYNKVLQQRNSLLKKTYENGDFMTVLDILDKQLITPAEIIYEKRKVFLRSLIPLVRQFYKQITNDAETVSLEYVSQLNGESFTNLLQQYRDKDIIMQRSNAGIHKDDIAFILDEHTFKNIASQGQRKSLLFALKLAEFEFLKSNKGFAPLLLLDDEFEKLDEHRMQQLLHWVCNENNGQVFITDTHSQRLTEALGSLNVNYQLISL